MDRNGMKLPMKKQTEGRAGVSLLSVMKILLAMYLVTGILLVGLAAMLYQMHLSESVVSVGIVVIYVASGFLGGFLSGKVMKSRKFLWGMAMGCCYFVILVLGSIVFQKGVNMEVSRFFTTLILCTASGMIGGMAS
ncbi:TIGR04086 family membrane protein [Lachnospiraceae bacterium 29-84]